MLTESDIIIKAKTRRAALEKQHGEIAQELAELQNFLAYYDKLQRPDKVETSTNPAKLGKAEAAIETAIELYKGDPVKTRDIYAFMQEKGYTIDSLKPIPIVSSYLGSSDKLESIRGKGWIVKA